MQATRSSAFLLSAFLAACAQADDDSAGSTFADSVASADGGAAVSSIADIGLQTPESVLYDEQADVYIVSSINGGPTDRDDNGFISRVRPTGEVESLKWIDGATDAVTLNAPKGLAVHGDTLFVSDIDSVRAFHRTSGQPLGARGVRGATFLNDLAVGSDGALYVTDTGVDGSFAPTGTDAVHRFTASGVESVASGAQLGAPNGIVVDGDALIMVGFGGNAVQRIPLDGGAAVQIATLPAGQLDGLVRLSDGSLLVSSWEGQSVYRVAPDGQISTVADGVEGPADIGFDTQRHRLLIPLFNGNRIELREVH